MERSDLPADRQIDLPSREIHVEVKFPQLELLYTDKQHTPPPLSTGR